MKKKKTIEKSLHLWSYDPSKNKVHCLTAALWTKAISFSRLGAFRACPLHYFRLIWAYPALTWWQVPRSAWHLWHPDSVDSQVTDQLTASCGRRVDSWLSAVSRWLQRDTALHNQHDTVWHYLYELRFISSGFMHVLYPQWKSPNVWRATWRPNDRIIPMHHLIDALTALKIPNASTAKIFSHGSKSGLPSTRAVIRLLSPKYAHCFWILSATIKMSLSVDHELHFMMLDK